MIEAFLSRLEKVRKSGDGYVACCPAHKDKNPSMSVTERQGKVLLHCFAGCCPDDILDAVGMKWGDFFAEPMDAAKASMGAHFGYMMRKRAAEFDPLERDRAVLVFAKAALLNGQSLGIEDRARVELAIQRLGAVNER